MIIKPTFQSWNCAGQRILLRADLNVPLAGNIIKGDRRLQAIKPTLNYLLAKNTQIILLTHLGRPKKQDPALSTRHLVTWFENEGYTIFFATSIPEAQQMAMSPQTIILVENVRFFPGEKQCDPSFAQQLATLAPWYVNDAFGTLHRTDTSMTLLAEQYKKSHRSIGFLIEKELNILNNLMQKPNHPVCFVLGGGKVTDKIPLIKNLCLFADTIILCPAIVFTFLKATNKPVGQSLIDKNAFSQALSALDKAKNTNTTIVFPSDYQVAMGQIHGPLSYVEATNIPQNSIGISIGPKTIRAIQEIFSTSRTIFYNGMMGFSDREETLTGLKAILNAMSTSSATTIVAGGDSIATVDQLKLTRITHCMTGGGSTLTYLSGKPLPGLDPFLKNR